MSDRTRYIVLSPVENDRVYAVGETIELSDEHAAPLLETGVIAQDSAQDARARILAGAIGRLPRDEAHYTGAGVPRIEALESESGLSDVSGAERDAAWVAFQQAQAGA